MVSIQTFYNQLSSVYVFRTNSQLKSHQSILSLKSKGFWFKPCYIKVQFNPFHYNLTTFKSITSIKTHYTLFIIQLSDQDESQSKNESICTKNLPFLINSQLFPSNLHFKFMYRLSCHFVFLCSPSRILIYLFNTPGKGRCFVKCLLGTHKKRQFVYLCKNK